MGRPAHADKEFCDEDHSWEQVEICEWSTGNETLDEKFHTVKYECDECDAWMARKEEKASSVFDWE